MERQTLVTIANFPFHTDPRLPLLTARLDHEAIPCSTADEITISADPLLTSAIGGIKVKVRAADAQRAWEIFQDIERETDLVPDSTDREWEAEKSAAERRAYRNFYIALIIVLSIFALFLWFGR